MSGDGNRKDGNRPPKGLRKPANPPPPPKRVISRENTDETAPQRPPWLPGRAGAEDSIDDWPPDPSVRTWDEADLPFAVDDRGERRPHRRATRTRGRRSAPNGRANAAHVQPDARARVASTAWRPTGRVRTARGRRQGSPAIRDRAPDQGEPKATRVGWGHAHQRSPPADRGLLQRWRNREPCRHRRTDRGRRGRRPRRRRARAQGDDRPPSATTSNSPCCPYSGGMRRPPFQTSPST